jgi:hypothetical protein
VATRMGNTDGHTERAADSPSAESCPHVQILPRLQKGKLLRAWMSLLHDQSLEIFRTERYGFPQLGVRTSRTIFGGISALTFLNAALHPALFVDDLAEVGLEGVSIFDERRAVNGKDTRLLFLGAGPARLINVSLDAVRVAETIQHACFPFANVRWLPRSSWLGLLTYTTCLETVGNRRIEAGTELTAYYGADYCGSLTNACWTD